MPKCTVAMTAVTLHFNLNLKGLLRKNVQPVYICYWPAGRSV